MRKQNFHRGWLRLAFRLVALPVVLAAAFSGKSATLTISATAPVPGTNDIYNFSGASRDGLNVSDGANYADGAANDAFTYVAADRASQGQTFTTGNTTNGCLVTAVWLRHPGYTNNTIATWWQMNSGATLTIRLTDPSQAGTAGFPVRSEAYVTTGNEGWSGPRNSLNGDGYWLRFAFASPVVLQTNKTYGFDVTSGSGAAFFECSGVSNNVFAGGNAYKGSTSGAPDNSFVSLAGDRVFLIEMAGSPATNPPTLPNSLVAVPFDLTNVTLLPGPFLTNMLLDKEYLLSLDGDRLLYGFRANAGLATSNAAPYGGWEAPGSALCLGHTVGHYLSACSMMYASTGDSRLKARADFLVAELAKCQAAAPSAGFNPGYLSAFPESYIDDVINQTQSGYFSVPWYTLHKTMAGLLDAYQDTGNPQALTVLTNMAEWVRFRLDSLSSSQIQAMLNYREFGGMNEVLANLAAVTGNTNHLRLAADFDKQSVFTPLSQDLDVLDGLHANTHIPQIIGAAREFELSGLASYHEIARFFWDRVVNYRSYVIGGNSDAEHFFPVTDFPSHVTAQTCETCNTYNLLKLTRHLFSWEPSAAAMDYYERALYNHILGSEAAPGTVTYFVSLLPGHFKTYSTLENSFWCCSGTGMENHAKYGDTIYFHGTNSLYLNLFIASRLNWPEKGLTVAQNTTFPQSDTTTLTFQCTNGMPLTLNIRYPAWAQSGMELAINGALQTVTNAPGSYVSLARNWNNNDQVQIRFPMTLHAEVLQNTTRTAALFYGPLLLAGALGTNGMPASDSAVNQWDLLNTAIPAGTVPSIIADLPAFVSNTVPVPGRPLTFQTKGLGRPDEVTFVPFYQLQHQRYSVYWNLMGPSAVCVWSGNGAPDNWSVGTNWSQPPTNRCAVQFGLPAGGTTTNDLAAGTQINGIQFSAGAGGFVLDGNGISLGGDVVNDSAGEQRINLPVQLTGGLAWYFDAAAGGITLGGPVGGAGSIEKFGAGTLTVLSNLAFSGLLTVSGGELQVGNGNVSGSLGAISTIVNAGASLAYNCGDQFMASNRVAGAGSVIKRGSGTMLLAGVWTNTGPTVIEAGALQISTQQVQTLAHRWSFNGSLVDSVGTNTAVLVEVGANNASLTASNLTLMGGAQSSSDYVSLGSGLLPKDGSPVAIELWATQTGLQNWSRIFDVGSSSAENLFMSWSRGTDVNTDRVEWKDAATSTEDNSCAPYSLNAKYHIVMVIEPFAGNGGTTRVTWYAAPTGASSLGAVRGSFDSANALSDFNDANFWLGRSEYSGDNTAGASYDEIRLWRRAFSTNELQQLHALGPDNLGSFASASVVGSLSAQSELSLAAGAQLLLGNSVQHIASLAGAAGSAVRLDGANLVIDSGTNAAATFAGSLQGNGAVTVNGALRLVGSATMDTGLMLTNNGTLDIMTWGGVLPAGFVNHGVVLGRSLVGFAAAAPVGTNLSLTISGYRGHNYQLQQCADLSAGLWQNVDAPVAGNDVPISFLKPVAGDVTRRFYRVLVSP